MRSLFSVVCCAALFLTACGGGGSGGSTPPEPPPPQGTELTASITPDDAGLDAGTPVVVRFNAPVATASLQLEGTFLALGPARSWSAGNETLTLTPPAGGWPRGQGGTLSVRAQAASGATMARAETASFLVRLQLTNGQPALGAIGQQDLASSDSQATDGLSERTLYNPLGSVTVLSGGRIFVADYLNNRILGYPAIPTSSNAPADLVLGQPDFTTSTSGTSQGTFRGPVQMAVGGGRMAVVDITNSRVLIWSAIPTASGTLPDVVIGQANFTSLARSCSATGMDTPQSVFITPDGKMLVADTTNHRVLVWLAVPTVSGTPPDLVLGQSDFTHCFYNDADQNGVAEMPTARTLWRPTGLWSDGKRLVVLDSSNNRALVWTTFPSASFQPAQLVLGQASFTQVMRNDDNQDGFDDGVPSARTLANPEIGVHSNGVQLAIADYHNSRVLVWNRFPTASFQPADAVLGQPDFASFAAGTAADRMNYPLGVTFHGDKLLVTDRFNNRVLVLQSP